MKDLSLFALLLFLVVVVDIASSFGGFFGVPEESISQAGETIIFGVSRNDDGEQDVVMAIQIKYSGPASSFSWILPVMVEPTGFSVGYDGMFTELFESSRPIFRLNFEADPAISCPKVLDDEMCVLTAPSATNDTRESSEDAIVLQKGTVGPYSTVVLQPAEENRGESVFNWLQENGYDQPAESFALIDYYAKQGRRFVALRLRKDSEVGDIQPIVLKYTLQPEMQNFATVPIQLTSIASTPNMPMQVYILSNDESRRSFPVNYFDVELDDTQVDWVGCFNSPNCYINDMRSRFARFLNETEGIDDHAFVTEYAGSISSVIRNDSIAIDIAAVEMLANTTSVPEIFDILINANVPYSALANTIIERYIPNEYSSPNNGSGLAFQCASSSQRIYSSFTRVCVQYLTFQTLDDTAAASLAYELDLNVFQPSNEAQSFLNSYTYLTRLYGQLSPNTMNKDPYFAFNPDLPDVSNIHAAYGIPSCNGGGVVQEMSITVPNDDRPILHPARLSCGLLVSPDAIDFGGPLFGASDATNNVMASAANQIVAFGYQGEESRVLMRSETGNFSPEVVSDMVAFMDQRVPNQTVLPYNKTDGSQEEDSNSGIADTGDDGQDQKQQIVAVISPDELFEGIQNNIFHAIIDVRTLQEWNTGHIQNATLVESLNQQRYIPENTIQGCEGPCGTIVVYCRSGARAAAAIKILLSNNFTGTIYNGQGVRQWTAAGYDLVTTPSIPASCSSSLLSQEGEASSTVDCSRTDSRDGNDAEDPGKDLIELVVLPDRKIPATEFDSKEKTGQQDRGGSGGVHKRVRRRRLKGISD